MSKIGSSFLFKIGSGNTSSPNNTKPLLKWKLIYISQEHI